VTMHAFMVAEWGLHWYSTDTSGGFVWVLSSFKHCARGLGDFAQVRWVFA